MRQVQTMEYDEGLYGQLVEAEDALEQPGLSQMQMIRLERTVRFLNQRIDDMETYAIQHEDEILAKQEEDRLRQEEENRLSNLALDRRIGLEMIVNLFVGTIDKARTADSYDMSMYTDRLYKTMSKHLESIDANSIEQLRDMAVRLLQSINDDPNMSIDYGQNGGRVQERITDSVMGVFSMLGLEGLELEFNMNIENDAEVARRLQEEWNK